MLCLVCLFSTRLFFRYGIHIIFIISNFIIAICNLLLGFFAKNLIAFILLRMISSIGYGIVIPSMPPLTNRYVYKNKATKTLLISDILIPLSYIFGTFFTSLLLRIIEYNHLFFIAAGIGLVHSIYITGSL